MEMTKENSMWCCIEFFITIIDIEQDNVGHQKKVLPLIISFKYEVTDKK